MSALGRYRKVYPRLWRHPAFAPLSEGEKLLALYLLTGPQTNRLGVYPWTPEWAAADLAVTRQTLQRRWSVLENGFGWTRSSATNRPTVVDIPSWLRWNPPENPNVVKAILNDLNEIPPCPARERILDRLTEVAKGYGKGYGKGLPIPLAYTGTGTGTGTEEQEPVETVENSPRPRAEQPLLFTGDQLVLAPCRRTTIPKDPS
jgi:hypothetical protein